MPDNPIIFRKIKFGKTKTINEQLHHMLSEADEIREARLEGASEEHTHMEGIDLVISGQTYMDVLEREKGREYVQKLVARVEAKNEARGYYED